MKVNRGVEQKRSAHQAHNLEVAGSNPAPAIMGPTIESGGIYAFCPQHTAGLYFGNL